MIDWFNSYSQLDELERKGISSKLSSLFSYDNWGTEIANFFKNPNNCCNFSTCHYCDTAYINAYVVDPNADAIYFLNNADSRHMVMKLGLCKNSINTLIKHRPFSSRDDFDTIATKRLRCADNKFDKVFKPNYRYRHHFDLDHAIPKSKCPFLALSVYNFVPSCQICNQKLKRDWVLGIKGIPMEKLSPTSDKFDFEHQTYFTVIPCEDCEIGTTPLSSPSKYKIELRAKDSDYDIFIKLFKLNERYNYHKRIAFNWLELKVRYTDARIQMMANALNNIVFSADRIKRDIFQSDLYNGEEMTFTKLRADMLHK
jgi:hypothetical protein